MPTESANAPVGRCRQKKGVPPFWHKVVIMSNFVEVSGLPGTLWAAWLWPQAKHTLPETKDLAEVHERSCLL